MRLTYEFNAVDIGSIVGRSFDERLSKNCVLQRREIARTLNPLLGNLVSSNYWRYECVKLTEGFCCLPARVIGGNENFPRHVLGMPCGCFRDIFGTFLESLRYLESDTLRSEFRIGWKFWVIICLKLPKEDDNRGV